MFNISIKKLKNLENGLSVIFADYINLKIL